MSDDPYLTLPLDGLRLIEASAGTGKTFTLATLFTRLVVEQGLALAQILTVTFTNAATQELRARIRDRLLLAAELLTRPALADDSAETRLTRQILERHLACSEETAAQLGTRLRRAVEDADLASIFTIHGFCARVLREYALESGQPLVPLELVSNTRDLYTELAADLWRDAANAPNSARMLRSLWNGPQALAESIEVLASDLPLRPEPPATLVPDPHELVQAASQHLTQAIHNHGSQAQQALNEALARKTLDGRRARRASVDNAFLELKAGLALGHWPRGSGQHIDKLTSHWLASVFKDGCTPPASPVFAAVQAWCEADDRARQWQNQQSILFLHRLRDDLKQRLDARKQQRQIHTHDDLINHLAHALTGEHAPTLSARLRAQYRCALVDEFQDTDPRQWQIFRSVFKTGLFLIGDPKQAIYSFRGGDLHTYLAARASALQAPPLTHNFRSRPGVLRALAALYHNAGAAAFGETGIEYVPILPGGHARDDDYLMDAEPAPALTICHIPEQAQANADAVRAAITRACAADIHRVLSAARAGRARIHDRPVKPGDIAVLVRSHKEATRIREALTRLGIPAVSAGHQSIFASQEALDIRLLLGALLHPSDQGRLRAALSSVLLGEGAAAIAAIAALDSEAAHAQQAQFADFRRHYQRSGIFALIVEICARHAPRLLRLIDGERRLSNTLQLAELLQQASREHPGLGALLDWLQQRIARVDDRDEAQQLRLESDARCVQIVTLHKSKGLEYPLVYLPFSGLESAPLSRAAHRVIHDHGERVLYWNIDKDAPDWTRASHQASREASEETARLLYVGLTRAKHGLWLAAGDWKGMQVSRLGALLHPDASLSTHPDIAWTTAASEMPSRLPPEPAPALPPPRTPRRRLRADWWVYSFTQLAHSEGQREAAAAAINADGGAEDEGVETLIR